MPLSLTLPLTAASLAYLNAKTGFSNDWALLSAYIAAHISLHRRASQNTLNLFYDLETHALHRTHSQHPFLIYTGKSWSYGEAYGEVLRWAAWLKDVKGVGNGEVVGLCMLNSDTFVWVWFALWSLGATPAFLNYNLRGAPLVHSVRASGARLVLVDEEVTASFAGEVEKELEGVEVVFVGQEVQGEVQGMRGWRERDEKRGGLQIRDLAVLIYTSGTTGLPKPAIVSWQKARVGAALVARWLPLKKDDIFYTAMPLYHSSAAILGLVSCLMAGTTLSLGRRFSHATFWPEVRATKATAIQYVGETCRYLLAGPPSSLDKQHSVRFAFGNGMRPDVWERFQRRFGIDTVAEFYAATEGPGGLFNKSRNAFSRGAVGRNGTIMYPWFALQMVIARLDFETNKLLRDEKTGLCIPAAWDEPGELLFRLDAKDVESKFQGYFRNRDASSSKIVRDVRRKGDAYFSSGDVMRWDREGRWWFCDRIGDTYRWKSENVSTAEVGECLGRHEAVSEANVYGVLVPGHDGRAGCAATLLNGAEEEKSLELSEKVLRSLAEHAMSTLPRYAVPIFLRVTRQMEMTGTNKQQKHILREQGCDPEKVEQVGDKLYWLKGGTYVPFGKKDWDEITAGRVKL
ncbi:long-chain fatty acid transporter fat1 [Coniosporium apollinis]|uniref:Long-chain fatty acid transporter fat1 n=1 Tax=Coniosporium apollinis TaxID=61459 RepID=A0ABQ9NL93_9PEZI|nr:long-chain fatty acid transporter fat1 [Coniosporium apollinis]